MSKRRDDGKARGGPDSNPKRERSAREVLKKVALGGGVALASAGLTNCNFGAVDPAPQPLDCRADAGGIQLGVTGSVEGDVLTLNVTVPADTFGTLSANDVTVTGLQGATLSQTRDGAQYGVDLVLQLPSPPDGGASTGWTGSLTVLATVRGYAGNPCETQKKVTFSTDGSGAVRITRRDPLPLEARQPASIALVQRGDGEVLLRARTRHRGPRTVEWTVSGGETSVEAGDHLRWRLPAEPGLYQVELVVDYGIAGLSVDTLAFEVA